MLCRNHRGQIQISLNFEILSDLTLFTFGIKGAVVDPFWNKKLLVEVGVFYTNIIRDPKSHDTVIATKIIGEATKRTSPTF